MGACAALSSRGFDPRRALHDAYVGSHYARTALLDGKPAVMWGVDGPLLGGSAKVWLALSDDIGRLPVAIVREARRELAEMADAYGAIEAAVLPDDAPSVRFAAFLGFKERGDRIAVGDGFVVRLQYGEAA